VFWKINNTEFLDKNRTMDNVQKHNICTKYKTWLVVNWGEVFAFKSIVTYTFVSWNSAWHWRLRHLGALEDYDVTSFDGNTRTVSMQHRVQIFCRGKKYKMRNWGTILIKRGRREHGYLANILFPYYTRRKIQTWHFETLKCTIATAITCLVFV
jgi:hypothetical protein